MAKKNTTRRARRLSRKTRIRKKIQGTAERPRLTVFRSVRHIYAQVVDDLEGRTLASASTLNAEVREALKSTGNKDAAKKVGEFVAKKCLEKDIDKVVFDRSGFIYHGRIKVLADAAREAGLKF